MPSNEAAQLISIDEAILACEKNIRNHRIAASLTIGTVVVILLITLMLSALGGRISETVIITNDTNSSNAEIEKINKDKGSIAMQETVRNMPYPVEQNPGYAYAGSNAFPYSNAVVVGFFGFCALLFTVIISIYRFHLKEITKNEQLKLGFMRIKIAANNNIEAFDSDVKKSLVESAFNIQQEDNIFFKKNKIENPMPGHPMSELSTVLINKILEGIDIKIESKAYRQKE